MKYGRNRAPAFATMLCLTCATTLFAQISPTLTIHRDQVSFLDNVPIEVTQSFDSFSPSRTDGVLLAPRPGSQPVNTITLDGINFHGEIGCTRVAAGCWNFTTGEEAAVPTSPPIMLHSGFVADTVNVVTFGLGGYVEGFGLNMIPHAKTPSDFVFFVIEENGAQSTFQFPFDATADSEYFGLQSSVGIDFIVLGMDLGQQIDFSMDDVSRTPILPEPSGITCLALGLLSFVPRRCIHLRATAENL